MFLATTRMSLNVTQTISSPLQAPRVTSTAQPPSLNQPSESERELKSICRDRFKNVIILSIAIQSLLLMIYSILLNIGFLHPVTWVKEFVSTLCTPLMLVIVIHGYFTLKPFLQQNVYHPTRLSKFIKSFAHESSMLFLNFFIGFFTALLFIRYLNEDFKTFTIKSDTKKYLNEKYAFLILNGAFIRCYFYLKRSSEHITFNMIHQSKFVQLRRQIVTVLKASFIKTLLPTFHFLIFYMIFGSCFSYSLRRVFLLSVEDSTILESFTTVINPRLLVYSWILSSLLWSNMELMQKITNIFATEPKQFPIDGASGLAEALSSTKFSITQQLAAQDLYLLADNPNNARRKQFYALSNPGGHPHNWKHLVKKSLGIIDSFSEELKKTFEAISKSVNNNSIGMNMNQPIYQFYEHKRKAREYNGINGIRSMTSELSSMEPTVTAEGKPNLIAILKQKLLRNRFVFYFLGETETVKLNFLLEQHSQVIVWVTQGVAAIIARSIKEDSYGVVQHDIKLIIKSFIKLKVLLDKVGTVNTIAKDRNFLTLKAAIRRSLYRITADFSRFFDDLLLDPEDIRALHAFVTYKEL